MARILSSGPAVKVMKNIFTDEKEPLFSGITIIIDAGHGGMDPGKIGINKCLEKDINLKIALKLKVLLEEMGIKVIMTREEDITLCKDGESNKKRADMNKRIEIINSSNALFAISIHQNSYTEEYVKGAQVFYYIQSEIGKNIASVLQEQIKKAIADGNHREAKSNDSYFMLRKANCPLVIVECGFLSNNKEASLLVTDEYQNKMADAISQGIKEYLNKLNNNTQNEQNNPLR